MGKHICKYCGAETSQPDIECYLVPELNPKLEVWTDSNGNKFSRQEDNSFTSPTASYSLTEYDILNIINKK